MLNYRPHVACVTNLALLFVSYCIVYIKESLKRCVQTSPAYGTEMFDQVLNTTLVLDDIRYFLASRF